ncbi:hypothetical protein DPQ22_08320 [Candidatus Tokpelaia sp.]|nr:hypothetical protein DPQ22_08320 [Candidatus Tokpelaia sp.]
MKIRLSGLEHRPQFCDVLIISGSIANRRGARSVQTAPGLDRLACGGGRNKEQARGACKMRSGCNVMQVVPLSNGQTYRHSQRNESRGGI